MTTSPGSPSDENPNDSAARNSDAQGPPPSPSEPAPPDDLPETDLPGSQGAEPTVAPPSVAAVGPSFLASAEQPAADAPGPLDGAAPAGIPLAAAAQPAQPPRRRRGVSIAVAVVIGALVGALVSSLVFAAVLGQHGSRSLDALAPRTVTVNTPGETTAVTAVASKAAPSVVTISVLGGSGAGTVSGSGSGVILSEDGYVLTNAHVVAVDGSTDDVRYSVTSFDGRLYQANLVGIDAASDLAVIQLIGAAGLTPIEWGDSDALNVGDTTIAIGAPLGLANTVTTGIVSALNRSIQISSSLAPDGSGDDPDSDSSPDQFDFWNFRLPGEQDNPSAPDIYLPVLQTDASINPGNSGGALVDAEGRLIGINVAIATTSSQSGSVGVGFAIPSSLAERVASELIETGTASHGLLGATIQTATAEESDVIGAIVRDVTPGGSAEAAGIQAGDIIVEFNGYPISQSTDLSAQVRAAPAESIAEMSYIRGASLTTVEVALGTLP